MKHRSIRIPPAELIASAALAAAGLFFAVSAFRLPAGRDGLLIGPGIAPLAAACVLILCSAAAALGPLLKARDAQDDGADTTSDPAVLRKTLIAILLLAGCALLFEWLGFMLSTFLFLTIGFAFLGEARLRTAAPAAAVSSLSLWLIFTKLLGVGLPYGLIGEILFR